MRSLEKNRSRDIDQKDPEHLGRKNQEFSWDDLKSVPFRGNDNNSGQTQRSLKAMLEDLDDSLLDDEARKEKQLERDRKKLDDIFKGIDGISSFGKTVKQNPETVKKSQDEFKRVMAESEKESSKIEEEFK